MSQLTGASDGSMHDCPVGQFVQALVFPAEYVPDAHTTGAAETVGQEYPAGHAVQEVCKEIRNSYQNSGSNYTVNFSF